VTRLDNYFVSLYSINENNFNKICENVFHILKSEIDNYAPKTKLTRKQKKLFQKPWVT